MGSTDSRLRMDHSSIEAALRGAGVADHPEVLAALAAAVGYDPRRPRLDYDWSTRDVLEEVIPRVLGWPGPPEAQLYRLGRATFVGWGETIVGRILSAPLAHTSPERGLETMVRILSMRPQFGTHTLTERGPRDYLIRARDDPRRPAFVAGLVVPAVEVSGGEGVHWAATVLGPEAYTLQISWDGEDAPGRPVQL